VTGTPEGNRALMIDRSRIRERHRELSYVTGRFMTEHLIRVHKLFEGDLTAATGVPRETVRRKVRWLAQKGWLSIGERGRLSVVNGISKDFQDFDIETTERLLECMQSMTRVLDATAARK